ncbi:MAG: pyridoxal phosphate-dependent aminotransferase [Clostridia bacterium]|nr:pyridoxal phosphate-dependent aminotransferase [Clostridia bacterium]
MKISKRANAIHPSLARDLFNKAKEYNDVIDLTLGDPDFDTPTPLKNAACKAINENLTHYSCNAGLLEARIAVSKNIKKYWKIDADPTNEVMLTVGGMEALYLALFSLIDSGDEVIVFAPYYVNYVQMIRSCDGIPVIIDAYSENYGFQLNERKLREAITNKTVAIVLNSPCNPTGAIISKEDLHTIAKIADEKELVIISDEVYHTLIFDNEKHESVLTFPEAKNRTVLIDSMSKEFCMTGWRIGYAYAPSVLIQSMVKVQENIAACAPLPSQYALIEAYTNDDIQTNFAEDFQSRRDYLYDRISSINGLICKKPQSTFYLFINISSTNMSSLDFAHKLLDTQHVAVVPGITYGDGYSNYIRIAFTKDISILKIACDRIEKFISTQMNNQ